MAIDDDKMTEEELYPSTNDTSDFEEIENEDGSVTFREQEPEQPTAGDSKFYDNLCDKVDQSWLAQTVSDLIRAIEDDKTTNAERDKKYEKGLKRAGAGEKAPGGLDFPGASTVTHPLLLESSIDFASSVYKELFPADGPCKNKIIGKYRSNDLDRSDRIATFMNWQLTTDITEFEETMDELLSQVPLAGSQYLMWFWEGAKQRPAVEYIPSDKMILPFAASSFYSAERQTYEYNLTELKFREKVDSGEFSEHADPGASSTPPDRTKAEIANDKIEGTTPSAENIDNEHTMWKCWCWLDIPGDKSLGFGPYVITIDKDRHTCVELRRNWEQSDERRLRMDWVVEWPFVRWRGPYSLGLIHLIGDLAAAATGALRALLDSAHVNTVPSALAIEGSRMGGQTVQINGVGLSLIKSAPNIDDIRKQVMPFPFNPPSSVLFQLLGFLVESGRSLVSTAKNAIAEASTNTPVGTTMAMVDQGGKVFSAIHKRLHAAAKRSLAIQYRLNKMYLTKRMVIEDLGGLVVKPEDFQGPNNIVPVSDPNIFSDMQRWAQLQLAFQLRAMNPALYNERELHERALQLAKLPDPEGLLVKDSKPVDMNPVAENAAMTFGQPVGAFPEQDHLAHLQTHLLYMQDPMFGANAMMQGSLGPAMLEHIKQHLVMLYAKLCYDVGSSAAKKPLSELIEKDVESRQAFDQLMATVAIKVHEMIPEVVGNMQPIIQQITQVVQQLTPPPPMDPTQAAVADIERQKQRDAGELQLKQQDQQQRAAKEQAELQLKQQDQQLDQAKLSMEQEESAQRAATEAAAAAAEQELAEHEQQLKERQLEMDFAAEQERLRSEEARNQQDNETALTIAGMRMVESRQNVGNIKSGKSVTNPNP